MCVAFARGRDTEKGSKTTDTQSMHTITEIRLMLGPYVRFLGPVSCGWSSRTSVPVVHGKITCLWCSAKPIHCAACILHRGSARRVHFLGHAHTAHGMPRVAQLLLHHGRMSTSMSVSRAGRMHCGGARARFNNCGLPRPFRRSSCGVHINSPAAGQPAGRQAPARRSGGRGAPLLVLV